MPINPTRLRELREARQMTRAAVADAAGLTAQRYGDLERGRRPETSLMVWERIAAAMGVRVQDLLAAL